MKQNSSSYACDDGIYDHEMEVASILLQLPRLIDSRYRLPLSWPVWGSKRKRSAEENSFMRRLRLLSPQSFFQEISAVLEPGNPDRKVEASSPATPLSFSPSESDEKPKRLKGKLSVKKRMEELVEIKKECIIANDLLRKEIEETRYYLKRLEAQNLSLQARRLELIGGSKKEENGEKRKTNEKAGPSGIPDLNISLPVWMDYFLPYDENNKNFSKAMAAQARQRRMLICRDKNFNAIAKLRSSRK